MPCHRGATTRNTARRRKQDPATYLWQTARERARAAGLVFTITPADVRAAWPADGRCPILGIRLTAGERVQRDESPSLDRVNPIWGYEAGNVAVVSLKANRAKGNMTAGELEQIVRWMRGRGLA